MQAPLLRWIKIPVLLQAGLEARAAAARRAAMMEGGGTALTRLAWVAIVRQGVQGQPLAVRLQRIRAQERGVTGPRRVVEGALIPDCWR